MGKLVKILVALATIVFTFAFVGCDEPTAEPTNSENIAQDPENPNPDEPNQDEHTHVWDEKYADNGDGTHCKTCIECGTRSEPEAHEYAGGTYTDNGNGTHSMICAKCNARSVPEKHANYETCESCGPLLELPDLVYVQGGTFQMGDTDTTGDGGFSDEVPVHEVTVGSFYMGKYEVTQPEYEKIMNKNPSILTYNNNHPVENVSWYDAVKYCNKRSETEGLTQCYTIDETDDKTIVTCNWSANGYRLPTEAEWEYAAKGGKDSKLYIYSGSNKIDDVAWYWENCGNWLEKDDPNYGETHVVGRKKANELGLYGMSGNVWEWCWDWHGNYSNESENNPTGPASGSYRVKRGGSWRGNAVYCRCAHRNGSRPDDRNDDLGFRVVRCGSAK